VVRGNQQVVCGGDTVTAGKNPTRQNRVWYVQVRSAVAPAERNRNKPATAAAANRRACA